MNNHFKITMHHLLHKVPPSCFSPEVRWALITISGGGFVFPVGQFLFVSDFLKSYIYMETTPGHSENTCLHEETSRKDVFPLNTEPITSKGSYWCDVLTIECFNLLFARSMETNAMRQILKGSQNVKTDKSVNNNNLKKKRPVILQLNKPLQWQHWATCLARRW